jgi:hypothetical protein
LAEDDIQTKIDKVPNKLNALRKSALNKRFNNSKAQQLND